MFGEDQLSIGEGIKLRIEQFASSKKISIREFERRCGITNGTVASMKKQGPTAMMLSKISSTYPELSADWLINGDKGQKEAHTEAVKTQGIPLLPFGALAGFMSENNGVESFTGDTVYFPDFSERGADYAIRVEGDSMLPRYNNGDVLAIKVLQDPTFFQWGRVYVISTSQGCLVKRLFPDPTNTERLICHSENTKLYPDFSIDKADVLKVAIVVGHAGVE